MDARVLVSALSLFAGVSLLPAVFLILRDKAIPLERNYRIEGGAATLLAFVLLTLAVLFLLNVVAQDVSLLIATVLALIILPLLLIRVDKRRKTRSV